MLDPWALNHSKWKKRIVGLLYADKYLCSAACIHALCESEYESIRKYGLKNPVAVIPNGIDLPKQQAKLEAPWQELTASKKKVMLFLGRIHPKKGLCNLIKAWSKIAFSDWVLVIAGWSQIGHEEELKEQVAEYGLDKDIVFLGSAYGDKRAACLQNANAFVLPLFSEGLPMSVLEAWAYGLPVIMTKECNIPEGFESNAAIEIWPDVESIYEKLCSFMNLSDSQRNDLGQKGPKLVENKFTWPRIASQMNDVYKWVLGQGDKPECVRLD
jgi:poly(glycerol-phosphate) alpha-glucosyltransferase